MEDGVPPVQERVRPVTDAYLLETADRVIKAKEALDLAEGSVKYYVRVLDQARVRATEKHHLLLGAMADLKALGGEV